MSSIEEQITKSDSDFIISEDQSYLSKEKKADGSATINQADEQSSTDELQKSMSTGVLVNGDLYPSPTEEELATLPSVCGTIPWKAFIIIIVELCERFAYYGLTVPFQNYMQFGPKDATPGALNLGETGADGLSNFFTFWCYVTPVGAALIADQFLGRYNTIVCSAVIYFIGILILTCTAIPSVIDAGKSMGGFVVSLIIIGLGTGGIKSNVSPLMAEQLPKIPPYVKTKKNGSKVIVDPVVTTSRAYMIFYWTINVGSLSVLATTSLESTKGFVYAYLLPLCVFVIPLIILAVSKTAFTSTLLPPVPSLFVLVKCSSLLLKTNLISKKLNHLALLLLERYVKDQWDDLFIDELKRALRACKTFLFYPIYWVCYGQMTNNLISQAGQMQTGNVSNDLFQAFDSIALIIFIPICDNIIYPLLRKYNIPFKPILRITLGFMFATASMIYAAVLQAKIYQRGPCYANFTDTCVSNDISVWIQIPAYVLIAFSEIFASITGLEFAFTKAPPSMKSIITALFLFTNAFGAILSICISSTAVNPKLTWMYTGIAVTAFIAGIMFWVCFHHYDAMEDEQNQLEFKRNDALTKKDVEKEVHDSYSMADESQYNLEKANC
nr:similar to S. cerevisiae PTR2 gene, GenBank Accession Number L11994 [Arabidopsis thaliana]